jgi:hypothetical protein
MTKGTMADLKTLFSEEAAQCRRLAEIATEQGIKEKLLEMAARFQALADGDNEASRATSGEANGAPARERRLASRAERGAS